MEYAIILDREAAFANALCRYLQERFPTLVWSAFSNIKALYQFMHSKQTKPQVFLYTASQFPDWLPTWSCRQIILREQAMIYDIFPSLAVSGKFGQTLAECKEAEVYRLDTKGIEALLRRTLILRSEMESALYLRPGKITVIVSEIESRQLHSYLLQLFRASFEEGMRSYLLPFTDQLPGQEMSAQVQGVVGAADLGSLLQRLSREVLHSKQILPYVFPTAIPGLLSFLVSDTVSIETAPLTAYRQLMLLIRELIKQAEPVETALVLCSKQCAPLLQAVLPMSDEMILFNSATALNNPATYRLNEEIKAYLPPGFPIKERCFAKAISPAAAPYIQRNSEFLSLSEGGRHG